MALVQQSERGDEFRRLEAEHGALHGQRREATLELLAARDAGRDLTALQGQIRGYDDGMADLRDRSKEIISEVRGSSSNDVNYVFPSYLINYVPAGLLGLMIAVIFAAAMSSLDSELTALSSATVIDFYKRWFKKEASDGHYLRVSRAATLFWGLFSCVIALYAGQLGSLIEAVNQVGSFFYGSLLGVFLLAFLVKGANGTGAFVGLWAGMASVAVVSVTTDISYLYYNVVGTVAVLAVGSAVSAATGGRGGRPQPA